MNINTTTTLEERLAFYQYAKKRIKVSFSDFLCHIATDYITNEVLGFYWCGVKIEHLKEMYPELCAYANATEEEQRDANVLWIPRNEGETNISIRLDALKKAIKDVKLKL